MKISQRDWNNYKNRLAKLSQKAADEMQAYVDTNGLEDRDAIIAYAYGLSTKYGEGAAELACQMYDETAAASRVTVRAAEPAATATYRETAKAINGCLKQSPTGQLLSSIPARLTKQAAADTTLKNAIRDGAEWAWVPSGDTCAFCIALASRGWQRASKKVLNGNHATHIHAHCDCQFSIRFDGKSTVDGYDPEVYREMYYSAEGSTSNEKINSLRRRIYAVKKGPVYEDVPKTWVKSVISEDKALTGANPLYRNGGEDYQTNCSNCVPAYEMRKRGYDVTAQPSSANRRLRRDPFSAWKNPEVKEVSSIAELLTALGPEENGSRMQVCIDHTFSIWKQTAGHTFIIEKQNNEFVFLDPQIGSIIDSDSPVFKSVNSVSYARIDNLEISDIGVSACKKE